MELIHFSLVLEVNRKSYQFVFSGRSLIPSYTMPPVLNRLRIVLLKLNTPDTNILRNHTSRKKRINTLQDCYISAKAHLCSFKGSCPF